MDCELDYKLVQKARELRREVFGCGGGSFHDQEQKLARVVSNGDSLDIELIVKLGKDCHEMAFMARALSIGRSIGRWGTRRGSVR